MTTCSAQTGRMPELLDGVWGGGGGGWGKTNESRS